ncbi:pilus assembly FimT family protein [Athalassotoga sp.]|uniref:pilus assembly FimT family protein n=1 Tax=Athalassotoga sp. TaxID=2022597 RepID=UPI003D055AD0
MKSGWSFVELLVLMVFLSILLSIIFPVSKKWIDGMIVHSEIQKIVSFVRYTKYLSYGLEDKVKIEFSKDIKIITSYGSKEKGRLSFVDVNGCQSFAFSKGVPYISGTMKVYFRGSKIATITVMPVTGLIKVEEGW